MKFGPQRTRVLEHMHGNLLDCRSWDAMNSRAQAEKKVLASIAYISSLRLMTSDPEVSFTIKKRPGARRKQWLLCPWLKKSCCLVRVA